MAAREHELSDVELRVLLEEAVVEAFELADELAQTVAANGSHVVVASTAANYMQARTRVRQLRRVIAVEAGG